MRFVANLRNETIEAFAAEDIQPSAYLLSSHRVTQATLASARRVRDLGLPLFADNGTKPLIDEIVATFGAAARKVLIQVKTVQRAVGRSPRGNDIPDGLRREADGLANEVVDACVNLSETINTNALIDLQTSMSPTDTVAQEDFATACLIGLNLEREVTGWSVADFEARNQRSLRLWERVAGDPRCTEMRVHAVLSAMDFNTAVAAGRLAAKAGVRHAALGFAGINLDKRAVDFYVIGQASRALEKPVPRRYVRVAQIASGLAEGFRQAGGSLEAFHCLGLGAPPLFPVVAAGFDANTALTTDATSPIHDAVRDHVLYDLSVDGRRASTVSIVRDIAEGDDWPFLSPFTIAFREQFGHNPTDARSWLEENNLARIERVHLSTPSDLTRALPLFTNADPEIFRFASKTWIAHNHWVLDALASQLSGADRRTAALASIARQTDRARPLTVTIKGLTAAREILERSPRDGQKGERGMSTPMSSAEAVLKLQLEKFPVANPAGGWTSQLLEQAAILQEAVVQRGWSDVLLQSTRCMGLGYAALRWLEGAQVAADERNKVARRALQTFGQWLKAIARTGRSEKFFTDLRDVQPRTPDELSEAAVQTLKQMVADRDIPGERFDQLLEQLKESQSDVLQVDRSLEMMAQGKTRGIPLFEGTDELERLSLMQPALDAAIACLSRGLLAWVHAEFNLAFQRSRSAVDLLVQPATKDLLAAAVDEFSAQLRAGQLTLYSAFTSSRPASEVVSIASALASNIEVRLPAFAHTQARLDLVVKRLRELGKGGQSEILGRLAVRAGALTREAMATHAASYRLAAALRSEGFDDEVAVLQQRAPSIPFDAKLPNGKNVELGKLDSVGDGEFIEIEGVVQALKAERPSVPKLMSQIELLDPSSGAQAQAVALFVNLPNMGVTIDAYCQLHGIFRRQSEHLHGEPAVEVDRLSLAELKEESWWVGFLQLADPWFPYWRNNTHIYWSLAPHRGFGEGHANEQGAAELIFLPTIRT